ncbi:MAG: LPS export ABC transporter ATP-binding protein [Planctomycetota bacterium]|nr:MAG: LPS export ABC transporter ATP-binding protein [Planctomycetota bacterium]
MLEVRGLEKHYKRPVVQGVDFEVAPGEVVGLLGPNGAGKTTTFRMTMGMVRPDSGTVRFLGQDVTDWPLYRRARAGMGYLPQEHSVFRDLSVEDNLQVVLERLPLGRRERRARCEALLDEYGLSHTRRQKARTLSGGQKRRLEIARALIASPRLMLFDEPFAGVDPIAVGDIQEIVYGLRDKGISVFVTDHDARQILSTSDRVYLMHEGRVVVRGEPAEILASETARSVYLGEDFRMDASELGRGRARGAAEESAA